MNVALRLTFTESHNKNLVTRQRQWVSKNSLTLCRRHLQKLYLVCSWIYLKPKLCLYVGAQFMLSSQMLRRDWHTGDTFVSI